MLQRMGCSPSFNTPNRPLSVGLVERTNQSIKHILEKLAEKHPRKWPEMLPFTLFALRTAVNETTGVTVFVDIWSTLENATPDPER